MFALGFLFEIVLRFSKEEAGTIKHIASSSPTIGVYLGKGNLYLELNFPSKYNYCQLP